MINAIQQLGLGVHDKARAMSWFARVLGFRTVVFDDVGEAHFMTRYTGDQVCSRDAALVLNSHGGSGLEVWQHISRKPLDMPKDWGLRSLGLLMGKLRCQGIETLYEQLKAEQEREPSFSLIGGITERPTGEKCCYFEVFGVWFQLYEDSGFFREKEGAFCAGLSGVVIGVQDMERSMSFYRKHLGYSHVGYDKDGEFADWAAFVEKSKENAGAFRRALLQREEAEQGPFAPIFGAGEIELIAPSAQAFHALQNLPLQPQPKHLYKQRFWGDPGWIHLCFDVQNLEKISQDFAAADLSFTVDTGAAFSMGKNAKGRFAYLEDPDGTLIEFVETYRIPLLPRLGIALRVQGRQKPLPRWLLKLACRDNLPQ